MLSLRIATRFLRRSPLQTLLLVAGIAVGIGVQVFLGSLITSLQADLIDTTIGSSSQVTVNGAGGTEPLRLTTAMREALESDPRITTLVPVRTLSAIFTQNTDSRPLTITGGTLRELDTIYKLSGRMVQGEASLDGDRIIVGKEFAERLGLSPGDPLPLVLPNGRTAQTTIAGLVDLGGAVVNERAGFVSDRRAAQFLGMEEQQYSAVLTQVTDPFISDEVVASLEQKQDVFGEATFTDWQAQNQDLLSGLRNQSLSSYMIQVFVLIAVALGIVSTLAISAVQKTRQVGILKAMGMSDARTGLVFFWQAAVIGLIGSAAGVGAGLALIGIFRLVSRGSDALFPISPEVWFVVVSFFVGFGVALVSSLIPARRTSRVDPIEVIQSL